MRWPGASQIDSIATTPTNLCALLLDAAHRRDAAGITGVLDHSARVHGLPATIDGVLLPALREVGDRWSRGQCDTAQERLATTAIQGWLHNQQLTSPTRDPVVVLSGGPAEQHTIGLEALAVLLSHHGLACLNLGARTSTADLHAAVAEPGVSAVVISCQLHANRASTVATLKGIPDTAAALYYAGAGFRTVKSRQGVPGTYLGGNLNQAAALLATTLTP